MRGIYYLMIAAVLSFLLVGNTTNVQAQTFSDVPEDHYYYEAVEQLVELGIISKNDKFNPENELTRGQMAKMIALALQLDTKNVKNPKFKDVPTSHQFYPYIAALANEGVVSGYSDGTYGVSKKVTRAHMAKFIVNGFQFTLSERPYFSVEDLKKGTEVYKNVATLDFYQIYEDPYMYEPNKNLLRLEAAAMLAAAIKSGNLMEIRIPASQLDFSLLNADKEYRAFNNNKPNLLFNRVDALNNELVLFPLAEGQTGLTEISGEVPAIQLDIDADLAVTYTLVESFAPEYKTEAAWYFYSEPDKMIRNVYLEQLTGDKEKHELLGADSENGKYYEDAYVTSSVPNELYKVTIEFVNGQREELFLKSKEDDSALYFSALGVGTESSVRVSNEYLTTEFVLREGNAKAVNIVTKWSDDLGGTVTDYIDISEPGTYAFDIPETVDEEIYWIKPVIEVFEIDGKLMYDLRF